MDVSPNGAPDPGGREPCICVAAAGDIHCRESAREEHLRAFASLRGRADLVLLAGDLTTHGEREQLAVVVDAAQEVDVPVLAVLGNHDHHAGHPEAAIEQLEAGGVTVLDRSWKILELCGSEVGVVGTKGFVGGFAGSHLPDFGEASLRQVYAEATAEVEALEEGLRAVAHCPFRIVLLHYAPIAATLEGERRDIWAFLGTDRLAAPIQAHEPDLVLHGHAHSGTFRGELGEVPVFNVSVPVLGEDFWVFELSAARRPASAIH